MKTRKRYGLLLGTASAFALQTTVHAEGAGQSAAPAATESKQIEEIFVTARKREESLQNVPVAVVAITKADLQKNDATDLLKLAELAPQVLVGTASTGTGALLAIRGVSSANADSGIDQSVAVSIDGVQLSRGRIITSTIYDMQQVEVMEGPQALFFGKNNTAGVISMRSADPTNTFEGYVKAGYEFEAAERYGEAAVSGPISDNLTARVAFRIGYMDGWIRNLAQPIADPLKPTVTEPGANHGNIGPQGLNAAARLSLLWKSSDDFTARFKLAYDSQDLNGGTAFSESYCTAPTTTPTFSGFPEPNADCAKDMKKASSGLPGAFAVNAPYSNGGVPYQTSKNILSSLTLDKKLGPVSLTATTGFYWQRLTDADNSDWSPYAGFWAAEYERYRLITQEIRANSSFSGPVNFTAGLYFEDFERPHFSAPILFPELVGFNAAAGNYTNNEQSIKNSGNTYSVFGEARWNIVPSVELAVGARYTHETKDFNMEYLYVNPGSAAIGLVVVPAGVAVGGHMSDYNLSPQATLTWHPTSDQTLYFAYKTGYKSGGFSNSPVVSLAPGETIGALAQRLRFGHETSEGEEIGYKSDLFDRRLRLNITAYRYEFNNLQVSALDPKTLAFTIQNAAVARTEGVELGLKWLATDELTFTANVGYNRARYASFPNAPCYTGQTVAQGCIAKAQNLSGEPLLRAPDVTFNLGGEYVKEFLPNWMVDMSLDGAYTSSYQTHDAHSIGGIQPSFWRLNAGLHIYPVNRKFEFAVIGRNLTDSYYMLTSNNKPGGSANEFFGFFNRPREVLVQAEYHF